MQTKQQQAKLTFFNKHKLMISVGWECEEEYWQ